MAMPVPTEATDGIDNDGTGVGESGESCLLEIYTVSKK